MPSSPLHRLARLGALFSTFALIACGPAEPPLVRAPADPPSAILVRNTAVLDVVNGAVGRGRDVLVRDGRIAAIGVAGQIPEPDDVEVIDGTGATLLPGLIDSHGHVSSSYAPIWAGAIPDVERNLQGYLYCGVTTVLDPADFGSDAVDRRDEVAAGDLLGPRIYTAGRPLTAPDGHPVAMMRQLAPWWIAWYLAPRAAYQVDSEESAREAVAELSEAGVDFLKVIVDQLPESAPRIDEAPLGAAVAEAHARALRAVAHIGNLRDALDAAEAGADAWVHGIYKERIDRAAAQRLARYGIPMVPTTVVFENYTLLQDFARVATPLEREMASAAFLASFNEPPEDTSLQEAFGPFLAMLKDQRQAWRENVRLLRDAGVTILAGSDMQSGVFPGAGLHRELALLEESGFTPLQAIRAATLDPARFLTASDDPDFGQVKIGKRADLLLVDGDPTQDLDALSDIRAVILGGVHLERFPVVEAATAGAP